MAAAVSTSQYIINCDATFYDFCKKHSGQQLKLFLLRPFQTTTDENAEQPEEIKLWKGEDIYIRPW